MRIWPDKVRSHRRSDFVLRAVLLGLPALAVLILALSWFVVGRPRAVLAARVYAGPAPDFAQSDIDRLAFRAQVLRSFNARETAEAGTWTVTLSDGLSSHSQAVSAKEDGIVSANLVWPERQRNRLGPLHLRMTRGPLVLAEGDWETPAPDAGARAGTGFLTDHLPGGVELALSLARGVLAVPFENELRVRLTRAGEPILGAAVELAFDGAEVLTLAPPQTDAQGQVSAVLRTSEHHVSVRVTASAAGETLGPRQFDLPVVAGALHASLEENVLSVHSPVPRERAYVNIVNARQTLWLGTIDLVPSGLGVRGSAMLPELPGPLWAVTSSELDLQSMALVGWPVGAPAWRATLDRRDRLLIDGFKPARARERARQSSMRDFGVFAALLAMLIEVLVLVGYVRQRNVAPSPSPDLRLPVEPSAAPVLIAVGLLSLGFAALTWLIVARM